MSDNASPPRQTYLVPPVSTSATLDDSSIGRYAFALPLSSIYSILIRPPSLGWWFGSVVINTRAGSSLPALFFHDSECESTILQKKKRARESFDPFGEHGGLFWGGDEVVRWLKRYVEVERSVADPGVYLINPSEEDRIGFGQTRNSTEGRRDSTAGRRGSKVTEQKKPATQPGPGMDPLTKALKETRWKVLEQLSKITTFTRKTAQDIADNPKLPPQMRRLIHNPEVQTLQDEFDSARLYLARWAMGIAEQSEKEKRQRIYTAEDVLKMEESSVGEFEILDMEAGRMSIGGDNKRKPVTLKEWRSYFDPKTGQLQVTVDEVKERIFHGGLDPEDGVRKEAWLFLLGVYRWDSTAQERSAAMNTKRDEFIRLKGAWWDRMVEGGATPDQEEWWKEQKGRIGKSQVLLYDTAIRWHSRQSSYAWRLLLQPLFDSRPSAKILCLPQMFVFNISLTLPTDLACHSIEKDVHRTDRHIPLFAGEDIPHPDPSSPFYVENSNGTNVHLEQLKDLLLTYLEYDTPSTPSQTNTSNPAPQNLGYVQGMSDLLAPLYAVFQDDAVAFWAFVGFMKRMARNFVRDQSGMRAQLTTLDQLVQILDPALYMHLQSADSTNFFFFFRMLLVWYKREFAWSDVLRLWEGLWTDYLSSQFHLFIAMSVLEKHRDVIMEHLKHFDEVLKYVNELSGTIELEGTMVRAEGLFRRFERTVEMVDRQGRFPLPNVRLGERGEAKRLGGLKDVKTIEERSKGKGKGPLRDSVVEGTSASDSQTGAPVVDVSGAEKEKAKVISPELRLLLSRKVIELDELEDVAEDGVTRASGLKD
jgi:hypothetical protein